MSKILSLLFLFSLLFPITTQAQIKLRTVADWEAGSIVLLNGYKFVKLNGPGGDGYFMAMEPLCNIPDSDSIIIDQVGQGTDENFTLSVSNATGFGPSCTWSATTSDGSPITPNWTTIPDANGRTTGCTIRVPKLEEETTFTPTITGCNMTGDLSTDLTIKTLPKTTTDITDEYITSMPSCTMDSCPEGATLELTDPRDNKSYTFRKLPDGKLWMVDNLAYGGSTTAGGTDYCSTRSTMADPNGSVTASNNFGSGYYGDCINPEYGIGNTCNNGACGYLYNWQAAMQHSTAYYNTSYTGPQTNVTGLCPAGFTLPTQNDFITLDTSLGGTGRNDQTTSSLISRYLDHDLYNGIFSGNSSSYGSLDGQGSGGHWWSTTQSNSASAYHLALHSSYVRPQGYSTKNYGLAIRCVKIPPPAKVTTTDITDEYIASMPSCTMDSCPAEATIIGIDDRDGKEYTFRKLPDGKLWMVDNLAYGGTTDACANKTSFSGDGSTSYTNQFGSNTYGDCVDPAGTASNVCASGGALAGQCGYLYNWQAAMQQQTAYYNTDYTGSQTDVTGLCPAGFTLPTQNDLITLDTSLGGTGQNSQTTASLIARYTNPTLYSGIFSGYSSSSGYLGVQGSYGNWWSSTQYSSTRAYNLNLNSSNVHPQGNGNKDDGFAVRCLK